MSGYEICRGRFSKYPLIMTRDVRPKPTLPTSFLITQVASYRLLVGVGERAKVKG
jgi:hypothetical protein